MNIFSTLNELIYTSLHFCDYFQGIMKFPTLTHTLEHVLSNFVESYEMIQDRWDKDERSLLITHTDDF